MLQVSPLTLLLSLDFSVGDNWGGNCNIFHITALVSFLTT